MQIQLPCGYKFLSFNCSSLQGDAAGKTALNNYINAPYTGDGTNLYDAVIQSINRAAEPGFTPKRAVIVLSDGVDNFSTNTLEQVIAYANLKEIPVFTVYFVDVSYQGGNYGKPEIMQRLANETGGQYYNVITSDIASIFQQISNILSNKYTLTYTPSTCSGTISVEADSGGLHGEASQHSPEICRFMYRGNGRIRLKKCGPRDIKDRSKG